MICDKDGVPLLIQHIHYNYGRAWFEVTFFNGGVRCVCSSFACPSLGLLDTPTPMQFLEAECWINRLARINWSMWFPVTSVRDYTKNIDTTHE